MHIEWAPWNVSMKRRLQVLAAGLQFNIVLLGGPISILLFVFLLFKGHVVIQLACLLYMAIIYYDRKTGDQGGRGAGTEWFRNLIIWKYVIEYYPSEIIKTVDLSPDRNYLFGAFPHGILSQGAACNYISNHSKWHTLYPGIRCKPLTLSYHFYVPFFREIALGWGFGSVSANSIRTLIRASNDINDPKNADGFTSNAAIIMIGGAEEAMYSRPNNYEIVLKKRKGFVKLALTTGTPLVPVMTFGEVDVFDQVPNPPGSVLRRVQQFIKKVTGVSPVVFNGRGLMQYSFGLIPRRHPLCTVVGAPIEFDKNDNPTIDDIDELHTRFTEALETLFETHKSTYIKDHKNTKLKIN